MLPLFQSTSPGIGPDARARISKSLESSKSQCKCINPTITANRPKSCAADVLVMDYILADMWKAFLAELLKQNTCSSAILQSHTRAAEQLKTGMAAARLQLLPPHQHACATSCSGLLVRLLLDCSFLLDPWPTLDSFGGTCCKMRGC